MFWRLITGFIVVIFVISSFQVMASYIYTKNLETEITNNVSEKFNNNVNEFEQYFNEIESKLLKDFYLEFYNYLKSPKVLDDKDKVMISKLQKYMVNHNYLQEFVVFINKFDYVLTSEGTYDKKNYFGIFNKNTHYTEAFWSNEMQRDFTYKIYPSDYFQIYTGINKYKQRYSMPVVLKNNKNSAYILIAFIDIKSFSNELKSAFMKDFAIYSSEGQLVYPENSEVNDIIKKETAGKADLPQFTKLHNGYIFTRKSEKNSLLYCKYFPNTAVVQQIRATNRLFVVILILSIIISLALSVYIVRRFNNPVKQIYRLIKESLNDTETDKDIVDLKSIKEGVTGIIDRDKSYLKDINEKKSMLENYLYQARLKNIFLQIDEPLLNSSGSDKYSIILIKIHHRDARYGNTLKNISVRSSVFKDIIQLYISEQFDNAITFQIENNQIVSIVNINNGIETIEGDVERIVQKLMTEDEYAYFTVAYSNVYASSSDLHSAYGKVTEILKHRKFINKTQVISENILDKKLNVFYFPEDQQKKFNSLLGNARKDECIKLIDKIFESNLKKEANEICLYLLYVQITDCCCNVLAQLYSEIPGDLPAINKDFMIGECTSAEDFKNGYTEIISECVDYISKNHKLNDYIVDYVIKYINENYEKEITVDLLADKLKITRAYLSCYFKKKTGVNLSDYLNNVRMNKACSLLQDSLLKIKDIAPKVGIYSISTFMRLFKEYTGKTPNDFRKSNL